MVGKAKRSSLRSFANTLDEPWLRVTAIPKERCAMGCSNMGGRFQKNTDVPYFDRILVSAILLKNVWIFRGPATS